MRIEILLFLFAANVLFSAEWDTVRRISPDKRIDVRTCDDETSRGTFVSANETGLVLRSKSGEQSISRDEIDRVRVADPSRRTKKGLLTTAIGAGIGLGIGIAICPHCANEGAAGMFIGPLIAIGAGVGATGFLSAPYRTIYKRK